MKDSRDPISETDTGHGMGGHRGINGIYRKVNGKCFLYIRAGMTDKLDALDRGWNFPYFEEVLNFI